MSGAQLALPGVLPDASFEWVWRDDIEEATGLKRFEHATVMREEVVRAIAPRPGGVYVDATLGAGGHTVALLEAEPKARIVALDVDPIAVAAATALLAPVADRVIIARSAFSRVRERLDGLGLDRVDGLVADLGISSPQIDNPDRGMSFRREGPIDMRMDPEGPETALQLIGRLSDRELADVLYEYGEERRSRRIAHCLKKALACGDLRTTLDLRRAIIRAVGPARVGGIDPATRTFQALRVAVNGELQELARLLAALSQVVRPGAVAAILSFHSIEDRLVKRAFAQSGWQPLTKKPLVPGEDEHARNPRARSAKLRAARYVDRVAEEDA